MDDDEAAEPTNCLHRHTTARAAALAFALSAAPVSSALDAIIDTIAPRGPAAIGHPASSYQMVPCWSDGQLFRPPRCRYRVGAISRNGR